MIVDFPLHNHIEIWFKLLQFPVLCWVPVWVIQIRPDFGLKYVRFETGSVYINSKNIQECLLKNRCNPNPTWKSQSPIGNWPEPETFKINPTYNETDPFRLGKVRVKSGYPSQCWTLIQYHCHPLRK